MTGVTKKELAILGKVFEDEINDRLPYQTKSKLARQMAEDGLLIFDTEKLGAVTIEGYWLSHAGRAIYCESCREVGDG